jgi:hypothetical protein
MGRQMVDGDETRDSDRLLVRPYIKKVADSPADEYRLPEGGADPAVDDVPAAGDGESEPDAVAEPAAPPRTEADLDPATDDRERRTVLWLVGAALALILATSAGVIAIWPGGEDAQPAVAPPPGNAVLPDPAVDPSAAVTPVGKAASAASSSSPIPSRSPSNSVSPSGAKGSSTVAAVPTPSTLAPPAADRVGPVTGPGGHCLDVRGGVALLGSPLAVYDCNGTSSQRWTVAADGTLRVIGGCAGAPGDGSVQVKACDTAAAGQWRARSGSTLLNVGTGQCLTDPGNGATTGAPLRLAACGGNGQRWALP